MTQKQMNDYHARNHKVNYFSVHFIDPRLVHYFSPFFGSITYSLHKQPLQKREKTFLPI